MRPAGLQINMPGAILIVEDSDACLATLEIALHQLGDFSIQGVTASEALQILSARDHGVNALITDLHMPNIDGFELIRRVRSEPRHANLPILAISGDSDPRTPARVRSLGADAYFTKPYSPAEVRQKLEQLIHAR